MFGTILLLMMSAFAIAVALPTGSTAAGSAAETGEAGQLALGTQPLYVVNETITVNSGWSNVIWQGGPTVVVERDRLLQGDNNSNFNYAVDGLSLQLGKGDSATVVIQIEALVVRGNATVTLNMTQGALGYTRIDLYAWNLPTKSFSELAPFPIDTTEIGTPCAVGRCAAPLVSLAPLYNLQSGTLNVEDAVKDLYKLVVGEYFAWYGNPLGPSAEWWHWGNPPGTGITNTTMDNTADYPLLGQYDSGDENVIQAQMAMAKYAGIDCLDLPWWGNSPGAISSLEMNTILRIAEQMGIEIAITMPQILPPLNASEAATELAGVVKDYGSAPAYLRDEGRPVIFIYAAASMGPPSYWEDVRQQLEAQVGNVVLIGDSGADPAYSAVFDGFYTYTDVVQYLAGNIEQWYESTRQTMAIGPDPHQTTDQEFAAAYAGGQVNADRKFYFYTVTPGNNNSLVSPPGVILNRANGTVYARQWNAAINQNASAVIVSSWNEWHEGAEIEPSLQYGFKYIDLTRQFAEEYKNTTLPGLAPRFSASVQGSNGELSITLSAATATPALMTKVEVESVGAAYPTISGNFTSYKSYNNATFAEVQVPYVALSHSEALRVAFEPTGDPTSFDIRVSTYDPSGQSHSIFNGVVAVSAVATTTVSSISTVTSEITSTVTSLTTMILTTTATLTRTALPAGGGVPDLLYSIPIAVVVGVTVWLIMIFRARPKPPALA